MFADKPRKEIAPLAPGAHLPRAQVPGSAGVNAIVIAAILFNALIPGSVAAQDATATPPPSETPAATETPIPITETATASPTGTMPPSATPEQATVASGPAILLSSDPSFITPSGNVMLTWELVGVTPAYARYSLLITLPDSLSLKEKDGLIFDEATRVLTVPVEDTSGKVHLNADASTSDALIEASLMEGDTVLAKASLYLARHEEFKVNRSGGAVEAQGRRIKIEFPPEALPEDVTIQVGKPSGDSVPAYSLSGAPFEITATGDQSLDDINQFAKELTITVSYADLGIPDAYASDLHLYYYDPATQEWSPLRTAVNKEAKTLTAFTDHFTVFDLNVNNFQASRLPTVDAFQVSAFTGAGTYSLPIQLPPGPSGFQPSLSLNYNSQVVDQSSLNTQASWAGMGWSLGTGSIEIDTHGTSDWFGDDTQLLNVGGISTRIVKDAGGVYHAADENFWKITFANNIWTVQDKQGNTYYFEKSLKYAYEVAYCETGWKDYQWMLTKVRNIYGQEILYTYTDQTKQIKKNIFITSQSKCTWNWATATTATYPSAITYAGGKYRVRFTLAGRTDYLSGWDTDTLFHTFEKNRLQNIYVEQDYDGNGVFETILRRYEFTYKANNASDIIFPGYTWTATGKTTTLASVQEYGVGGAIALPAVTFIYGDNLHLTSANNGYGGAVTFAYETMPDPTPYYYPTHAAKFHTFLDKFGRAGSPCYVAGNVDSWLPRSGSVVTCENNGGAPNDLLVRGTGYDSQYTNNKAWIRPGGVYKLSGYISGIDPGTTVQFGLSNGVTDDFTGLGGGFFKLPATAGNVSPLIKTTGPGYVQMMTFKFELMTSVYRVTQKSISDGNGHTYTFGYSYSGAAVNDLSTSPTGQCGFTVDGYGEVVNTTGCYEFFGKFSEFRGHAQVTETGPDGVSKVTAFHQSDTLKGRPSSVTTQAGGLILAQAIYSYTSSALSIATYTACNVCSAFLGMGRYWVYTNAVENRVYNTDGITFNGVKTLYAYEAVYGNLTSQTEQGGSAGVYSTYRSTTIDYAPNVASYLVGFPARQQIKDAGGAVLAETLNIYDANTLYSQSPTVGKLIAVRTWVTGAQYSQVAFGYDTWGNRTTITAYSGYGTASATPTVGARTLTTAYDTVFHVYPVSQTTPLTPNVPAGLITSWNYDYDGNGTNDYILGVPTRETDVNGNQTSAQYDAFGRMTRLIRPGDDSANPTITIAYQDFFPFTTTITQKITATQTYTVTRKYDGMGRQTQVVSGGITVDTVYDSATMTRQSLPYDAVTETPYFTTQTVNPAARTVTVLAPDGTTTTSSSNGLTSTVTDGKGNSTQTTSDVWGRVVSVIPPIGPSIAYTYDELNRLKTATRGGMTTTITYDNAGRKTSMSDPDMGNWSYTYDALGNLITQTDARGCTLTLGYDNLNRLLSKSSSDTDCGTNVNTSYTYDEGINGKGFRTGMDDGSGSTDWLYDTRGRLTKETRNINGYGNPFVTEWGYNSADMPTWMKYPDTETVNYNYNARMMLDSLVGTNTYVSSTLYDSAGRMTQRVLGNGLTQTYDYYDWNEQVNNVGQGGRLQNLLTGTLQDLNYTYDKAGNIVELRDDIAVETSAYGYDTLNRLTSWTLNSTTETYGYNASTGNLETKAGVTLNYNDAAHVHAVTSLSNGNTYQYDSNGNQTTRVIGSDTFTLIYDAENRLVEVKKNGVSMATFVFDGDGRRVKSVVNGTTTYFAGGHYELTGSTVTKYYFAGMNRIAMRKYTIPQSMSVEYLLGDHLGSTSITTDANGAKVSEMRYKPWGEVRYTWISGQSTTPAYTLPSYTFTGQYSYMDDPSTSGVTEGFGLMFYNARMYDPAIGRFTSADTVVAGGRNANAQTIQDVANSMYTALTVSYSETPILTKHNADNAFIQGHGGTLKDVKKEEKKKAKIIGVPLDSQSLDRYAYAHNSPVQYTDPSGHAKKKASGDDPDVVLRFTLTTAQLRELIRRLNVMLDYISNWMEIGLPVGALICLIIGLFGPWGFAIGAGLGISLGVLTVDLALEKKAIEGLIAYLEGAIKVAEANGGSIEITVLRYTGYTGIYYEGSPTGPYELYPAPLISAILGDPSYWIQLMEFQP